TVTGTVSFTITESALVVASGTQTNVLCNGASTGAIDLSVVGGSGSYTYLWSNGATTQDISGLAAGTYSVVITESNSCTVTGTVSFTITESALVVANAGATAELTCAVSTLVLNGSVNSEDQDGFAYSWIGPNSFTSSIRKPTISIPGTYTLTVTNADGCSASDSVVITQDITVPTAVVVNNNGLALDCNTPSTTLTASGGVSYLWSTGATTASITVSTGGIYTVTVKGANGCSATSSVTTTLDSTQPVAVIANNNGLTLDCNTTSTTLMASGGVSYLWSTGATTASIAVSKGGTFTVRVTGANGCSADASVKVTESTSATQASITGNAVLTCAVQSITLDASTTKVTGTASYLWNTGATTATIVVTTPGVYSVTVKGSTNGCSAEASVTVVQNTTPPVVTIGGNQTLTCSVSSIVLNASSTAVQGTASYLWNTGATTASITVSAAGDFSVKVTDSSNGCSATQSIKVTENYVAAQITAGSISLCIEDASLDLTTLLPTGFVSGGSWKDNNNSGGLSGSMFNPSIVNLADYSFTYSEPGDCGRIITVMVNVNDDCVVLACSTEDLVISKVVTPNGDGFNDNFEITGLEGCDFTFGVKIFNRWGKIVYQTDNYHNNWNGRHDGTGVQIGSNNELPTGTYYYIVTVSGGTGFKPITGYIYLGTH
ncbi:MAG: gliding motility-associated C-terminal domain-containing protein, partial [Lutibacter sp.]